MGTKKGYAYIAIGIVLFFISLFGSGGGEEWWVGLLPWWIAGSISIIFGARSVKKAKLS